MKGIQHTERRGHPLVHRVLESTSESRGKVLEVGSGPGYYAVSIRGEYIGVDITREDYHPGNPRSLAVVASARYLPFNGIFDLVFCSAALYHFPSPYFCLCEMREALKPGGKLLIFEYSLATLRRLAVQYRVAGNVPSVSLWTGRELARMVRDTGFRKVRLTSGLGFKLPGPLRFLDSLSRNLHDRREGMWVVEAVR